MRIADPPCSGYIRDGGRLHYDLQCVLVTVLRLRA